MADTIYNKIRRPAPIDPVKIVVNISNQIGLLNGVKENQMVMHQHIESDLELDILMFQIDTSLMCFKTRPNKDYTKELERALQSWNIGEINNIERVNSVIYTPCTLDPVNYTTMLNPVIQQIYEITFKSWSPVGLGAKFRQMLQQGERGIITTNTPQQRAGYYEGYHDDFLNMRQHYTDNLIFITELYKS